MESSAKFNARQISTDITQNRLYEKERVDYLKSFVSQRQKNYKVGMVETFFDFQKEKMTFVDITHPDIASVEPTAKMMENIYLGKEESMIHPTENGTSSLASFLFSLRVHQKLSVVCR
jgi:two-component system nitrogen regulation sensor histidine kinase NtrY